MEAYILVKVEVGKTTQAVETVAKLEGVRSAHSVTGPYDIIAAVEVPDLDHLGSLAADIHSIAGIRRTITCIAVTLAKKKEPSQPWGVLRVELMKLKSANEPIRTLVRGFQNWIDEVGDDYVVMRSERTGKLRKITKGMIESSAAPRNRIIGALRRLGGYF